MKQIDLLVASALALVLATPAVAQDTPDTQQQTTSPDSNIADIVVTAQRQSQRLQDVPIAVSAFTAETLRQQQINNSLDLQLTLPSITFTKTNFTSSSFTIRGIGDLCVGVTCDSATAIHVNDMPLLSTRLFESEIYDLERVEVLRGPQGTLFGRNATSGVVNFISAKPDLSGFHARGEFEYGNYDSKRFEGMINAPVTETIGVRIAGVYLNRDGYTKNLYTGHRIDGRDLYSLRGSISWEPSADTRLDLIGYYFRENDDRARIQKQLCHRDPTGVLGCLPDRVGNETTNYNSTFQGILTSREFLTLQFGGTPLAVFTNLALGSVYGTDQLSGATNPSDVRTVNLDYEPTYFAEEEQYTAKLFHDFGPVSLNVTGGYSRNEVSSRSDYFLSVNNSLANNPGLVTLATLAAVPNPTQAVLQSVAQALIPNGPAGGVCQSDLTSSGVGVFGGASLGCFANSREIDESSQKVEQYSVEAHVDSKFDGMFNFLLGAIYFDSKTHNNSYYVGSFAADYASALLGAATTLQAQGGGALTFPNVFLASPYFRNNTDFFELKSWGAFGESYFEFSNKLKLTLGLRYNHDDKFVRARTTLLFDSNTTPVAVPYGSGSITDAIGYSGLDFDPYTAGAQEYAVGRAKFNRLTGRAVLDYRITPNNLLYFSFSRGYKSGGINPPLSPVFAVPTAFQPEKVDAFEIGSKNSFGNGALQLNLTGFYYKYANLQLSRIVSRTSVNDNVSANIYGVEAEAILRPTRRFTVNVNASWLRTEVSEDKYLTNPRDPSGGRTDAVIIKDITIASNCVVVPTTPGNALQANGFVALVNQTVGAAKGNAALLAPPTPIPGMGGTTGAYGYCAALQAAAAAPGSGVQYLANGVPVNIKGNKLPQAPTYKVSVGAQYAIDFANGMSLVPRADLAYTGDSYASIFNGNIDRVRGYAVINAQIQLNSRDDRWYARAFVRNLTNNNAITGQYVTDQSTGLFTNAFTLEPRRFGIALGANF